MDGDDAPHAGNDSGKHSCIFAGIQVITAAADTNRVLNGRKSGLSWLAGGLVPCSKLVPAGDASLDAQVAADHFSGQKPQINSLGKAV
jgi:hypothetical protein